MRKKKINQYDTYSENGHLSHEFVHGQIAYWNYSKHFPNTPENIENATNDFFDIIKENKWKDVSLLTEESVLAMVAQQYSTGGDRKSVYSRLGDNSNLSYFDSFLQEGATDEIIGALKAHGISTEILKGVKKNLPVDIPIGDVRVIQNIARFDEDGSPTSPVVSDFEIYQGDNLIYKWERKEPVVINWNKPPVVKQVTKAGKDRKSRLVRTVNTDKGNYTYEIAKHPSGKNVTIKRDAKGHFARKKK